MPGRLKPQDRQRLSGWVCDQQGTGLPVTLDSDSFERIKSLRIPTLPERANRLLRKATAIGNEPLSQVSSADPSLWGTSYSVSEADVRLLVQILLHEGLVRDVNNPPFFAVTPKGHIEVERQSLANPELHQGFVAMWFDEAMKIIYETGLGPAIERAGYRPLRIDNKEHSNKVDDEIVAEIRRSRFLVADFTGHRGGVYFETGFAMGLGLQVFFTCRHDAFKDLHFDIRQYNTILWKDAAELKERLYQRIRAVIGEGPNARS
ncbi:MAG: hypothetical protein NBV67_16140 [Tagaea sp.]|nr:hypothetical protein [Tagaea sp.]